MNDADPSRRTSRDEKRERTHERMVKCAVELIRREGVAGVTASRITQALKVHRSLFYAHFDSLDQCLAEAAHQVLGALIPVDAELRANLILTDPDNLVEFLDDALGRWMEQRPFVELLLALRLDRSSFGETLRPTLAATRSELAAELWDILAKTGVPGRQMPRVSALADAIYSQWLWALECLTEERIHERRLVAETIADSMYSTFVAAMRRMRSRPRQEIVDERFSAAEQVALKEGREQLRRDLGEYSDAEFVERFGGVEATVEFLLSIISSSFLPAAAVGLSAVTGFAVETPGLTVRRRLAVHDGSCHVETTDPQKAPRFSIALSLRSLLRCVAGDTTFQQAFTTGEAQLDGDVALAVEFAGWFHQPQLAANSAQEG